jgi:hypothetical protein
VADLAPFAGITRIEPFTGLVIDPPTWGAAHEEHRLHQRLHLLGFHGTGIAQGLSVLPGNPPSAEVIVEPGVAVDGAGETIVVGEPQRVAVDERLAVAVLALIYEATSPANTDEGRGRLVEGFRIEVLDATPKPPALELARIAIDASGTFAIEAARNPWAPRANEIDLRFRPQLSIQTPRPLRAAVVLDGLAEGAGTDHLEGFSHLLNACALAGLHVSAQFAANGELPDAELLYVAGRADAAPSDALVAGLRQRVGQGSWLFADACGAGTAFTDGLEPVFQGIESGESAAQTEANVAGALHVFGAPPDGSTSGELRWGPRALLSGRDYGCAWQGRSAEGPLPRSQIRDALEFGVNVAACAAGYARSR